MVKKKFIFVSLLLIISFLIAGFIIYANNTLLPIKVKSIIIRELEKNLEKNVSIERLRYHLVKGFVFEGIKILDRAQGEEYLTLKEISFQILIIPLLHKQIIIPTLRIESPKINLVFRQDNTLNLMDGLKKWKEEKGRPGFTLTVNKIDLSDGKCRFVDEHTTPSYSKDLEDLKIWATLNLPAQLKFKIQSKIINNQKNPSFISTAGEYNFVAKRAQLSCKFANMIADEYIPYLKSFPFSISKGTIEDAQLDINLKSGVLAVSGKIKGRNLQLRKEKFGLKGNIDCEPDIAYDLGKKEMTRYNAKFNFTDTDFSGGPAQFKEISKINGEINLEKDKIRSKDLRLKVFDNLINISGSLEDFSKPKIIINLNSQQLNLQKLASCGLLNLPQNTEINGKASVNIKIEGLLNEPPFKIQGSAEIISAKIILPFLKQALENINGLINTSDNKIAWQEISFIYNNIPYKFSGNLLNLENPDFNLKLESEALRGESELSFRDKVLKINRCAGKFINSEFDIKGAVNLEQPNNPVLSISLNSSIFLKDAFSAAPKKISDNLKKVKVEGECKVDGNLSGRVKDPKTWNASFKASSPSLSINDLKIDNIICNLSQKGGMLDIPNFNAKTYGGSVALNFHLDLLRDAPAYNAEIVISKIDLEKLKNDTKLKEKDLSGLLSLKSTLQGTTKTWETLFGEGEISVKDGKLWELDLLKGLGNLLFLPVYQKIIFKSADINFLVQNKNLLIVNSLLNSDELILAGEGKVGFDGKLDLTVQSEINSDLLKQPSDLKKITSAVLGNFLNIKIGGTIQKPQYSITAAAEDLINQIKQLFFE